MDRTSPRVGVKRRVLEDPCNEMEGTYAFSRPVFDRQVSILLVLAGVTIPGAIRGGSPRVPGFDHQVSTNSQTLNR